MPGGCIHKGGLNVWEFGARLDSRSTGTGLDPSSLKYMVTEANLEPVRLLLSLGLCGIEGGMESGSIRISLELGFIRVGLLHETKCAHLKPRAIRAGLELHTTVANLVLGCTRADHMWGSIVKSDNHFTLLPLHRKYLYVSLPRHRGEVMWEM